MVELLQLAQAGIAVTAVAITVVVTPAALITGEPLPDISPLLDTLSEE